MGRGKDDSADCKDKRGNLGTAEVCGGTGCMAFKVGSVVLVGQEMKISVGKNTGVFEFNKTLKGEGAISEWHGSRTTFGGESVNKYSDFIAERVD